jgi:hypothetical protein
MPGIPSSDVDMPDRPLSLTAQPSLPVNNRVRLALANVRRTPVTRVDTKMDVARFLIA